MSDVAISRQDGDEWEEDGIRFRMDFGQPIIIGLSDEYTAVIEDEGEQIEWEKEPIFVGTYRGSKMIEGVESLNGPRDVLLLRFVDKNGVKRSAWGNYQLDFFAKQQDDHAPVDVVIQYVGKKEFGKSGQTLQAFNIHVKNDKSAKTAKPVSAEAKSA